MKYISRVVTGLAIILAILFLFRQCKGGSSSPVSTKDTVVVVDTVWLPYDSVVYSKPLPAKIIHDTITDSSYNPHPDYDSLKAQYLTLVSKYRDTILYSEEYKLPGLKGGLIIDDSVSHNRLTGRKYRVNYKIPEIIKTEYITVTPLPRNKWYAGGSIYMNYLNVQSINTGIILKTKSDHLISLHAGITTQAKPQIGVGIYWNLSK